MQIDLETRIVIITGPSTTGKSTLARSIKESSKINTLVISHDDIASIVNQNSKLTFYPYPCSRWSHL